MGNVMSLLQRAEAAGLRVWVEGDRLLVHGPRRLEPLAKSILARKPEVVPFVTGKVVPTQNQCGSCLAWALSRLVHLDRGARIYLCSGCFQRHQGSPWRSA